MLEKPFLKCLVNMVNMYIWNGCQCFLNVSMFTGIKYASVNLGYLHYIHAIADPDRWGTILIAIKIYVSCHILS